MIIGVLGNKLKKKITKNRQASLKRKTKKNTQDKCIGCRKHKVFQKALLLV